MNYLQESRPKSVTGMDTEKTVPVSPRIVRTATLVSFTRNHMPWCNASVSKD